MTDRTNRENEELPVSVCVFFATCDQLLSRLIRWATGDAWSHCGMLFTWPDGSQAIVEALMASDVTVKPFSKLLLWRKKHPGNRLEILPLHVDVESAGRMWLAAQTWVGSAGYGAWQLVAQLAFEKWGLPVRRSMGRVVCCELVARIAYPDVDLRSENRDFDELTPGSVYRCVQAGAWLKNTGRESRVAEQRPAHAEPFVGGIGA